MATIEQPTEAMDRVFSVYELVENISSHLPARDVLFLSRVSRLFNNVMRTSLCIKKKFMIPDSSDPGPLLELPLRPSVFNPFTLSRSERGNGQKLRLNGHIRRTALLATGVPDLGGSWRNILAYRESTREMKLRWETPSGRSRIPYERTLTSGRGITLGQMIDFAHGAARSGGDSPGGNFGWVMFEAEVDREGHFIVMTDDAWKRK